MRDIIVVGTSAGGLPVLKMILSVLPEEFPATLVIAMHLHPGCDSKLVDILSSSCSLPVRWGVDDESIERGHIYVAPVDRHLVFKNQRLSVHKGPRENRTRPAINPLFRTAAAEFGSRVIGVLLSGMLDDGVSGLDSIARSGGLTVVQDPKEAEFSSMPQHAIDEISVDHVLGAEQIGEMLSVFCLHTAPQSDIPREVIAEARLSQPSRNRYVDNEEVGQQVPYGCPECGGPMWKIGNHEGVATFRCHTGHSYSAQFLIEGQNNQIEDALWAAIRALTERARMLEKLADHQEKKGIRLSGRSSYRKKAEEAHKQSEEIRTLLMSVSMKRAS